MFRGDNIFTLLLADDVVKPSSINSVCCWMYGEVPCIACNFKSNPEIVLWNPFILNVMFANEEIPPWNFAMFTEVVKGV